MIIKVKNWYFVKTLYEYGDVHVMTSRFSHDKVHLHYFNKINICTTYEMNTFLKQK